MDYPRGIEAHGNKIRIRFQSKGIRYTRYLDKDPGKAKNISEAVRCRADYINRLKYGLPLDDDDETHADNPTFYAMAELYLRSLRVKPSTFSSYQNILNQYWMPHFDGLYLRHMRYSHVLTADNLIAWPSAKTRKNAIIPLRGVFKLAIQTLEGFDTNFASKLAPSITNKKDVPAFTAAQRDLILDELLKLDTDAHDYFTLAFQMGCRVPGELNAVCWEDYDKRSIHIHQEFSRCKLTTTKTHQDRKVLLTPEAKAVLENRVRPISGGYIFAQNDGKPWLDGDHMNAIWRNAMANAEIPWRRAYNCRHTRATLDLMAGGKPAFLASQLGHTLDQFFKVYATWISSDTDDGELDLILAGRGKGKNSSTISL